MNVRVCVPCALQGSQHGTMGTASWLLGTQARAMAEGSTYLPKEQVTERVVNVVKNFQKVDPSQVSPEANFNKDLGLDSLDSVEVMMAIEEEFGVEIPDAEADKIETCGQAIDYLAQHPTAK